MPHRTRLSPRTALPALLLVPALTISAFADDRPAADDRPTAGDRPDPNSGSWRSTNSVAKAPRVTVGRVAGTRTTDGDSTAVLSLKLLATPSPVEREWIAHELARRGTSAREALPALREVAGLEPIFARMAVGRAIWRIDNDTAPLVAACEAALDTNDATLRGRAASQLGDLGPAAKSAAPRLRSLMAWRSSLVRVQAAEALLRITPADIAPVAVLSNELENPQPGVATQAAFALGATGPAHRSRARRALQQASQSGADDTKIAADVVLAEFAADPIAEPVAEVKPVEPKPAETRLAPNRTSPQPTPERVVTADVSAGGSRFIDPSEFDPAPRDRSVALAAGSDGRRRDVIEPPARLQPSPRQPLGPIAYDDELPKPAPTPETAPDRSTRFGRKPIYQCSLDIKVKSPSLAEFAEERYEDSAAAELAYEGHFLHAMGTTRPWMLQTSYWEASGFCHQPLYFENPNSERYGIHHGKWIQPIVEAGRFYGNVLILPYRYGSEPPCECQYVLGHYRPGDRVPCMHQGTIRPSWRGAATQAAAVVGLIYIVP